MAQPPNPPKPDLPNLTDFQKSIIDDLLTKIRNEKRPEPPLTRAAIESTGPSTTGAGSGPGSGPNVPNVSPVTSPEGLTPEMRRQMMNELQSRILAGEVKSPDEVRAIGSIQQTTEGSISPRGQPTAPPGSSIGEKILAEVARVEREKGRPLVPDIPEGLLSRFIRFVTGKLKQTPQGFDPVLLKPFEDENSKRFKEALKRFEELERSKEDSPEPSDSINRRVARLSAAMIGILEWTDP